MSKETPAERKEAAKKALADMMKSSSAPGKKQAKSVLADTVEKKEKTSKPRKKTAKKIVKAKVEAGGKAQNMGLSLHPADQERLFSIENALRKAGIRERAATSLLIKLAIAAFDPDKVENLAELYESLKSQDGRRKG